MASETEWPSVAKKPRISEERKSIQTWGKDKRDFIPVRIKMEAPKNRYPSSEDIVSVSFKTRTSERQDIEYVSTCYSGKYPTRENTELESRLADLKDKIRPLECLFAKRSHRQNKRSIWDWYSDSNFNNELCRSLARAYLFGSNYGMDYTLGKQAVDMLLREIIARLELKDLEVIHTDSAAHLTLCSTYMHTSIIQISSSSSGDESETIIGKVTTNTKGLQPHKTSSLQKTKFQKSASDILVFTQKDLDQPIQTKLVVSLKKGTSFDRLPLIKELISRLPYQPTVYGIHLGAETASLFRVEYISEEEERKISIYSSQPVYLRQEDQSFNFEEFWEMVLTIANVISEQV